MKETKSKTVFISLALILTAVLNSYGENLSTSEIVQRIVERATRNERETAAYGFDAAIAIRYLKKDGSLKKVEARDYRTVWEGELPRLELHRINHAPLTLKQRQKEEENRREWKKAVHARQASSNSSSLRIPITWEELCRKYDFTTAPGDGTAAYVLGFKPKRGKLQERSRIEKVLNHMTGTLWADADFRILRLKGSLNEDVKFGFGFVKVDRMEMDYQQRVQGSVVLPAKLELNVHVKALVFKNEERRITTRFYNFRRQNEEVFRRASQQSRSGLSEARK